MSPAAVAGTTPLHTNISDQPEALRDQTDDTMDSNHDLPARTLREDCEDERLEQTQSESQPPKDDPATMAASEELKHTTISDKVRPLPRAESAGPDNEQAREGEGEWECEGEGEDKAMGDDAKARTPEMDTTDAQDEEMRERLSSPKKKRGRDQDEDSRDPTEDNGDDQTSSADGSVVNGNRTTRSEPEKKRRPRDTSEDFTKATEKGDGAKVASASPDPAKSTIESTEEKTESSKNLLSFTMSKDKPHTSASAFASSGFASLAGSSTSPFGSLGVTKPSVFGGGTQASTSGFGALASPGSTTSTTTTPTANGFGAVSGKPATGFGFGIGASSGFGGLGNGNVFGSKLGNGFAGGAGPKLSSFAAPGKDTAVLGSKPPKAFGAPESDEDEGSEDGGSDGGAASDDEESGPVEDKKKSKIARVHIDDGEANEATLLQMRAKLFALESKEAGWKERGVGTLKVNVPKSCVSYDDNGVPISGSFDASGIDDEDSETPLVARLIMRQENTHRVILNTIIVRAMEFQEKPAASAVHILFTAFEGEKELKPINMLLKMSEANSRLFRSEIDSIQRELCS